jgi:nitrogen fixation protein FixH
MTQHRVVRPFTGRHMAAILVTFFGVVIVVNVIMARLATSTFGGVVVENSYVASQNFNRWLGEARGERALGWNGAVARSSDGALAVTLSDAQGHAGRRASDRRGRTPLGLRDDLALTLNETAPGHYAPACRPGVGGSS